MRRSGGRGCVAAAAERCEQGDARHIGRGRLLDGFVRLEDGATELRDEKGYVAGVEFALDVGDEASLIPILEVAWLDDFGGQDQQAL